MAALARVAPVRGACSFVVLAVAALLVPAPASADAKAEFTDSPEIVWSTTVRLLRVDLGCDIAEQDRDNGYLLFVVHSAGHDYNGSLEVTLGTGERGVPVVEMSLRITGLPLSAEETILRKLRLKLRADYGLPPRPPAAAPEPEPAPTDEEGTTPEDAGTNPDAGEPPTIQESFQ